jgi:putative DNA primase/helicase
MASDIGSRLSEYLSKLDDVVEENGQYRARCPAHGGHSLLVKEDSRTERVFFTCKGGCEYTEILPHLRNLGIRPYGDSMQHTYLHADGTKAFIKVRWRKDGVKKPPFYKCLSKSGVPVNHRSKSRGTIDKATNTCTICGLGDLPKLLYNLPIVNDAIATDKRIWLVEGEKDADSLTERDEAATTTMNGADDWNTQYREQLTGASEIIIVPDMDEKHSAGKRGAWKRYVALSEFDIPVRVVRAAQGKDVFDHFSNGHGVDDFVTIDPKELAQFANPKSPTESLVGSDDNDPIPNEEWTELGYSKRYVAIFGDRVKFVPAQNERRVWTGTHWQLDNMLRAQSFAAELARRMTIVAGTIYDESNKRPYLPKARERESYRAISNVVKLSDSDERIVTPPDAFDRDASLLTCLTGSLDNVTLNWRPHDPADMNTHCIPFRYDPDAWSNIYEDFICSSIPNEEQRVYFQTLLGFALVGGIRKKRIVNLIGPKDTGKSTLLRLLNEILGSYVVTPAVEELVSSGRSQADKFALHELYGARMALISETERGSRFRTGPLKAVTGGDMISTQAKGRQPINWRASVMLFIATNEQVMFDAGDRAFTDRLVHIEFKRTRGIDRSLNTKLEGEKPGILNWILEGVAAYLSDEMTEPDSIVKARENAENAVTTPYRFIEYALTNNFLVEVPESFSTRKLCQPMPLYKRYKSWCAVEEGLRPARYPDFKRVLEQRYPLKTSQKGQHFSGLAPKSAV